MSRRKPVDPEKLAAAVATLREVAQQFPGTGLAAGSVAAIELGKPALILEAARVFGRRLATAPKLDGRFSLIS